MDTNTIPVSDLVLDLENYRTVRQPSEDDAVRAMISTRPDRFWALMKSLLSDGYLPMESVLVLKGSGRGPALTVKEGNRRVAALKLIHGFIDRDQIDLPDDVRRMLDNLNDGWYDANRAVPCVVFGASDSATVDKIVSLAHGKGEQAGRDQWNAVARSRHNRDAQGASEPGLDLLEKYLGSGKNLTPRHAGQWSGDYPLTVLDEALKRLAPRLGFRSARELSDAYPKLKPRNAIEAIVHAIGMKQVTYQSIRDKDRDFATEYGIPLSSSGKQASSDAEDGKGAVGSGSGASGGDSESTGGRAEPAPKPPKDDAASLTDPTRVKALLKAFTPKGDGRAKVVLLRDEARLLNLSKTPLAFCFVLRSMFEISAKAYCDEYATTGGPSAVKSSGQDRNLVDILRDITKYLTNNETDKAMVKRLHGAMSELGRPDGLLSVTSMNQLVHNPTFMVGTTDICILFGNVCPLLEAMNA